MTVASSCFATTTASSLDTSDLLAVMEVDTFAEIIIFSFAMLNILLVAFTGIRSSLDGDSDDDDEAGTAGTEEESLNDDDDDDDDDDARFDTCCLFILASIIFRSSDNVLRRVFSLDWVPSAFPPSR